MATTDTLPVGGLAGALAAFQLELPRIGKGNTAKVKSDKASYSYRYADLAEVSAAVLPVLGKHGLAWSTTPTVDTEGRFVLRYKLMHSSGESESGIYPLPAPNSAPQALGSAITYARRYCLCAVTGVSPDEDDDGAAAQHASRGGEQRANGFSERDGEYGEPTHLDGSNAVEIRDWTTEIAAAEEACDLDQLGKLWREAAKLPIEEAPAPELIKEAGARVRAVLRQRQMAKLFALLAEGGVTDEDKPRRLRVAQNLLARQPLTTYAELSDAEIVELVITLTGLKKVGTLTQRLTEYGAVDNRPVVTELLSAHNAEAAIALMEKLALRDDADADVAPLLSEADREALGVREGQSVGLLDLAEKVVHYCEKHGSGPRVLETAA